MNSYLHSSWLLIGVCVLVSCTKDSGGSDFIVTPHPTTIQQTPYVHEYGDDVGNVEGPEPIVQGVPISQYYQTNCSGCHGSNREGLIGPALLPQRLTQSDAYYFDVIQNGKPGTLMPAWGGSLTDEEINLLIAFIRSEPDPSALVWDLSDIQSSFQVLIDESTLPSSPTHSGNLDNLMLVTEREISSIAAVDGDTHTLLSHIPASYRAHGYCFDPTSNRWAFNVGRDGWVFKIDLYTLQAVRKIRVGLDSRGIAISDNGQYLIIGDYLPAQAVILNAQTLDPLTVISTQAQNMEGEIVDAKVAIVSDVSPALVGPYFIIALKEAGQMWRINWGDPTFPIDVITDVGHVLHDGFLSSDNTRFYVASQTDNWMAVLDVVNWTLVTQISTGSVPHPGSGAVWFDSITATEYAATVHVGEGKISIWDISTNILMPTSISTVGAGLFIRSSENSPYVWADAVLAPTPEITVFEKTPPFNVVGRITEGIQTLHPEFTEDGAFVYVSDWQGNVVRVYDATTLTKVTEITGITTPTGIFNSSRRLETLGH